MTARPIEDTVAGNAFRDTLVTRANEHGVTGAPLWHGWAIMEAFLAGVDHGRAASALSHPCRPPEPGGGEQRECVARALALHSMTLAGCAPSYAAQRISFGEWRDYLDDADVAIAAMREAMHHGKVE